MSQPTYTYGSIDPISFVLTDSNGDGVTGHSLVAADVQLSAINDYHVTFNPTGPTHVGAINIGTECEEGDNGFYYWTPSVASRTQHSEMQIFINDSVGADFVENRLTVVTGGHALARFSGTL